MAGQMGCAEAVRRLWDYLDRSLDETDQRAVDAHLDWCMRCCGELEFAREVRRLLRDTHGGIPADAQDRLERFIDGLGDVAGTEATS